jgi:hypothetical protein
MFEDATPGALITEIEASQQQESALMAHRLAAIAALLERRIAEAEDADPDPGYAMITGFARTTAGRSIGYPAAEGRRAPRRHLRYRPHHPVQPRGSLRRRPDRALGSCVLLPRAPPAQDLPWWTRRVA